MWRLVCRLDRFIWGLHMMMKNQLDPLCFRMIALSADVMFEAGSRSLPLSPSRNTFTFNQEIAIEVIWFSPFMILIILLLGQLNCICVGEYIFLFALDDFFFSRFQIKSNIIWYFFWLIPDQYQHWMGTALIVLLVVCLYAAASPTCTPAFTLWQLASAPPDPRKTLSSGRGGVENDIVLHWIDNHTSVSILILHNKKSCISRWNCLFCQVVWLVSTVAQHIQTQPAGCAT